MRVFLSFLGLSLMAAVAACSGDGGEDASGGGGAGGSAADGGGGTGGGATVTTTANAGGGGAGGSVAETGCESSDGEPVLFGSDVQPLFQKSCGGTNSCHFKADASGGLPLHVGQSHAALVAEKSAVAACNDRTLVVPGNAAQSYLIDKLREKGSPEICGKRMPYEKAKLPESDIQTVVAWICQGAKND